jgi:predicted enzyme related to lactoylglutathione lyase
MNQRVIHFEIQADDIERAKNFYEKTLGWKISKFESTDQDMPMDYWMVETGEGPGISGGMYQRPKEADKKYFLYDCTVQVENLDKAMEAVRANGGEITMEKSEIKDVGWFASAKDTEGNKFGLMQPTMWQAK